MTTTKQSKTKLYAYLWDTIHLFYGIYYVLWGIKITSTEANRVSYSWVFQIRGAHVFRKNQYVHGWFAAMETTYDSVAEMSLQMLLRGYITTKRGLGPGMGQGVWLPL